jgi:hypothetical protein
MSTKRDLQNDSEWDWVAIGYIMSIVSVFFLAAIAWPRDGEPLWYMPALIVGMATSVLGMGFRYRAHIHDKKEIREAKREAQRAERAGNGGQTPVRKANHGEVGGKEERGEEALERLDQIGRGPSSAEAGTAESTVARPESL